MQIVSGRFWIKDIESRYCKSAKGRWSPERSMGLLLSHSCIYSSHGCLSVHICGICMSNI